tara:strand:- start:213 stop:524 length:312 start_codon:yes stop_codon:yes gene_type:complete
MPKGRKEGFVQKKINWHVTYYDKTNNILIDEYFTTCNEICKHPVLSTIPMTASKVMWYAKKQDQDYKMPIKIERVQPRSPYTFRNSCHKIDLGSENIEMGKTI